MTAPGSRVQGSRRSPDKPGSPDKSARGGLVSRARAGWPAITGTAAAASVTLALLVLVCAFVAVAVPRASLGYRTAVLQRAFHAAAPAQKVVLADGDLSGLGAQPLSAAMLETAGGQLALGLRQGGLPLAAPRTQWSGLATGTTPLSGATAPGLRHIAAARHGDALPQRPGQPVGPDGGLDACRGDDLPWRPRHVRRGGHHGHRCPARPARRLPAPDGRADAGGRRDRPAGQPGLGLLDRRPDRRHAPADPARHGRRAVLDHGRVRRPDRGGGAAGAAGRGAAARPVELPAGPERGDRRPGRFAGTQAAGHFVPAGGQFGQLEPGGHRKLGQPVRGQPQQRADGPPALVRGHRRRRAACPVAAVRQPGRDRRGGGAARCPPGHRAPGPASTP